MAKILEELLYTEDHEWVLVEENRATIGITDFAQSSLGDIVFVELPEAGEEISESNSFGVVESIKSVSDLYTPLSGKVTEKNALVEETPELLNEDSYDNWLIKLELNNKGELSKLMDSAAYKVYCQESA